MKILFTSPCSDSGMHNEFFMAPALGVLRLAGFLKSKGHYADYYNPNLFAATNTGATLEEKLQEHEWDIIGFSMLDETLVNDLGNIHLARRLCPNATLVAGGIEAQFNYQTILDKSPCQIVIIGEGEIPMLMLAENKPPHTIPGIVFKNDATPMTEELFNEATSAIEWEDIPYEKYWDVYVRMYGDRMNEERDKEIHTIRVFSRNRCPVMCKFCTSTNQLTWGSGMKVPVISASHDTLISVIKRVVKAHPRVKTIYLTDDDFCINKRDVIRFCQKISKMDFGDLTFMCFARVTDLTDEMLMWMKRANFRRLNIGVESFSQTVLAEMGKRCDAEQVHHGLRLLKKHGIRPFMNLILITPKTRIEDLELTIDQALAYTSDPFYNTGFAIAVIPQKGSAFYEEYCDFKSKVFELEGTPYHIRKDEMIWAEDPVVREIQSRYYDCAEVAMAQHVVKEKIVHKNATYTSVMRLRLLKSIIEQVRKEWGIDDEKAARVAAAN